jgi:glycosyltransferase involved in cell wall biosynthesis
MPAFNKERAIARMVLGCKKYVDTVVVVDEGSTDRTAMGARKEPQMNTDEHRYDYNNIINIFQQGHSTTNHLTNFPEVPA